MIDIIMSPLTTFSCISFLPPQLREKEGTIDPSTQGAEGEGAEVLGGGGGLLTDKYDEDAMVAEVQSTVVHQKGETAIYSGPKMSVIVSCGMLQSILFCLVIASKTI